MDEIASERSPFAVLAVGVYIVGGNFLQTVCSAAESHTGLQRGERGILRAEDDVVSFKLPLRVFPVCRDGACDVRRVAPIFARYVHHDDIAIGNLAAEIGVMEECRMKSR